jgi:hypothetical protein
MTQHIANAPNVPPRLVGLHSLGLCAQSESGFADNQQRMQDRKKRLLIRRQRLLAQPHRKPFDAGYILEYVFKPTDLSSEGKHRVLLDAAPQPFLAHRLGDNIDRAAENVPKTPDQRFQPSEIGEPAS